MPSAALILCGGRSSRMGRDKAGLTFGGESALARIVRLLLPCVDRVAVVAAPDQLLPQLPDGISVFRDPVEGLGPLVALRTGLHNMHADCDPLFLTACDAPFPQADLVRYLIEQTALSDIAVPYAGGHLHPLFAAYRRSVGAKVDALSERGNGSLRQVIENCDARRIGEEELRLYDSELLSLRNVNTWEEYQRAICEL